MRVLIIEDELRLAENLCAALRETGLAVDHAADGFSGEHLAQQDQYDIIILDLMLPGKSGFAVLRSLRQKRKATPVLILTAQEDKASVIELLNAGADDYLSKPFDLGELIARVKALIRRGKGVADPVLHVGDIEINSLQQTARRGSHQLDLSPTEYRILEYFMHRPRAVISKRELSEHLYDYDWEHHSNVIEVHISNLRRKLDATSSEPLIETLRQRGYRLCTPRDPS
jgi:two-component system, OmpR family, response regulator